MNTPIMKPYGAILAGGRSRRFDGHDKAWLLWQGGPLIQHVILRLMPQVKNIVISANQNIERYTALSFPVIRDIKDQHLGPLMGIYSVMEYIDNSISGDNSRLQILTVPCDTPLLPSNIVKLLKFDQSPEKIHVAHDGQRLQPLVSLIPMRLKAELKQYLDADNHKVDRWIQSTNPMVIDLAGYHDWFRNINDPSEFDRLTELNTSGDNE